MTYQAGTALDRPYANYAWLLMAWGHLFVFGMPLAITALAMFTQSPVMASNAMYFWYICYDLGYKYLVVGVSLLFMIMMESSWEFYVRSDSI